MSKRGTKEVKAKIIRLGDGTHLISYRGRFGTEQVHLHFPSKETRIACLQMYYLLTTSWSDIVDGVTEKWECPITEAGRQTIAALFALSYYGWAIATDKMMGFLHGKRARHSVNHRLSSMRCFDTTVYVDAGKQRLTWSLDPKFYTTLKRALPIPTQLEL